MRKIAAVVLLLSGFASAQSSAKSWDLAIWFAGGHSVPGGTGGVSVFDAGLRIGKVLTHDHGPGILRGNFEYAIDLVPMYVVHQNSTAYGAGFNPINLKWNFSSAKLLTPYLELGGGTLFTTSNVPAGTNSVNFRTHAGFGVHFSNNRSIKPTLEVRYEHISNAGLASPNPGINTLQVLIGMNWFTSASFGRER